MKRWAYLLLAFAAPLSSPLACGGDGCLRNSDCATDKTCRAGKCELKDAPVGNEYGGESAAGGEATTPSTGGATAGSAGSSAGSGGKAGSAGSAGTAGNVSAAGADGSGAGEGGAGGAGGDSAALGGAGEGGAL